GARGAPPEQHAAFHRTHLELADAAFAVELVNVQRWRRDRLPAPEADHNRLDGSWVVACTHKRKLRLHGSQLVVGELWDGKHKCVVHYGSSFSFSFKLQRNAHSHSLL